MGMPAVFPLLRGLRHRLIIPGMKHDARVYAERYYAGSSRSLAEDMAATAGNPHGVTLFSPALVALLQPCRSTQAEPWRHWGRPTPPSLADAWYVHLLVGDLALARCMAARMDGAPEEVLRSTTAVRRLRSARNEQARQAAELAAADQDADLPVTSAPQP